MIQLVCFSTPGGATWVNPKHVVSVAPGPSRKVEGKDVPQTVIRLSDGSNVIALLHTKDVVTDLHRNGELPE